MIATKISLAPKFQKSTFNDDHLPIDRCVCTYICPSCLIYATARKKHDAAGRQRAQGRPLHVTTSHTVLFSKYHPPFHRNVTMRAQGRNTPCIGRSPLTTHLLNYLPTVTSPPRVTSPSKGETNQYSRAVERVKSRKIPYIPPNTYCRPRCCVFLCCGYVGESAHQANPSWKMRHGFTETGRP